MVSKASQRSRSRSVDWNCLQVAYDGRTGGSALLPTREDESQSVREEYVLLEVLPAHVSRLRSQTEGARM